MVKLESLTDREFKRFRDFIYEVSGIHVPDTKKTLLSNRIRRRLRACASVSFTEYLSHVTSSQGAGEVEGLLNAVTTNETSFFRTDKHFEWLETEFIREVTQQHKARLRTPQLRIWSAACSTGEEPYSIAICLAANQLRLSNWSLKIVATDISRGELDTAQAGIYKERSTESLDPKRLKRYFKRNESESTWEIKPSIRSMVEFQRHNILDPLRQPSFDCVFIRNVLIYFDKDSKQRVIDNLIDSMSPAGYLVVGPSEGIFEMLAPLKKHSPFLYQRVS